MSIHLLDQKTIDRIAAGEVVERPASIVKELVENAIDAGATRIAVEIKGGGVSLLRVTDNGSGISKEELPLAFARHATSKIEQSEDLLQLSTFGFRGEALSSIAAVARVDCITKTADALCAYRYQIEGGVEKSLEEIGAPDGTSIIVRDLFYNTPARGKFLKTAMTEAAHIGSIMEAIALSHPGIAFQFTNEGKELLLTNGQGSLKDVIFAIFGKEVTAALIEIPEQSHEGVQLHGFIAKPVVSRGNRNYEKYFVNGRAVQNRLVDLAIEEGYGTRLMQHRYPFSCLFIDLPGDLVDVNVHPTKKEVRFLNEKSVHTAIKTAVENALKDSEMIIRSDFPDNENTAPAVEKTKEHIPAHTHAAPFETALTNGTARQTCFDEAQRPADKMIEEEKASYRQERIFDRFPKRESAPLRRLIGAAFQTYWLVEFEDTLFLIDQHAAHEKILYERLMREYKHTSVSAQQLSPPLVLSLTSTEAALVEAHADAFAACGFQIEDFGGREIKLSAVPYHLSRFAPKEFFTALLAALEEGGEKKEDLSLYVDRIATEACKAAVKGGNALSFAEAKEMIDELFTLEDPYHCPHGRPTVISMTKSDLEKRFKRVL